MFTYPDKYVGHVRKWFNASSILKIETLYSFRRQKLNFKFLSSSFLVHVQYECEGLDISGRKDQLLVSFYHRQEQAWWCNRFGATIRFTELYPLAIQGSAG